MKKKSLTALGLIIGFSVNTALAENSGAQTQRFNNGVDRLTQARRNAISLESDSNDAILNARNLLSRSRKEVIIITENRTSTEPGKRPNTKTPEIREFSTGRKKEATEKFFKDKNGKRTPNNFPANSASPKTSFTKKKLRTLPHVSKKSARIYEFIYNARNLEDLKLEQRMQILKMHKRMLKMRAVRIFLDTIQKGEGGEPTVIVGKGIRKGKTFRKYMRKLNLSTHMAYQFPKEMRCFVYNKQVGKCSTASGNYQITKTNFDKYANYFGLKDFSVETQKIIALELVRTGKAVTEKGNYKGRGYVELIKGNYRNAIRYGTNDWASSPHSQWGGAKTNYLRDAEMFARAGNSDKNEKKKDRAFFQNWIDESETEESGF